MKRPILKRPVLAVLAVAMLSGCAISQVTLQSDLAKAKAALSQALQAYGIAKGIAEVAVAADPALAIPVAALETIIDPLIPLAESLLADATANATQVTQMVQQIQTQVIAVETTTAGQIKVISNKVADK